MFLKKSKYIFIGIIVTTTLVPQVSFSSMQSSNYQVQFDSINFGGGYSSSSNYQMESTGGEIATGNSTSTNYQMRAGYQQINGGYIAITEPNLINLGSVSGLTASTASSSAVVNVVTDSYGGYQLTIQASTSPALKSSLYHFDDYAPLGVEPDFLFNIPPSSSEFGLSVSGTDTLQKFKNNGTNCNAGTNSTPNTCWVGLSTTPFAVAQKHSSNHPLGSDTIFTYQASVGSSKIQEQGMYQAEIIITATAL